MCIDNMPTKRETYLVIILSVIISISIALFSLESKLPNSVSQPWFTLFLFILSLAISFLIAFIPLCLIKLSISLIKKIIKNLSKPDLCLVCKKPSSHYLNFENSKKRETYCHIHLLEKFQYHLLQYNGKCIALKPQLRGFGSLYAFTALDDMQKYSFSKEDQVNAEEILTDMKNECNRCKKACFVIYFPQESYSPRIVPGIITNLKSEPTYLCKECFWNEIKSYFQLDTQIVDNEKVGVYYQFVAPYGKSGIFCSDTQAF